MGIYINLSRPLDDNETSMLHQHHEELTAERATTQRKLNYLLISWRDGISSIDDDLEISTLTDIVDDLDNSIYDIEYVLHAHNSETWGVA